MSQKNPPSDDENLATEKAIAALQTMAEIWSAQNNISADLAKLLQAPEPQRSRIILNFVKQAFVEGAYKHYCDAMDGNVPGLTPN